MRPRRSLVVTWAVREGDVERVERDEELFGLPEFGKDVNDALLLSDVPHEPLVHDPVMVEGVDARYEWKVRLSP